MDSESFANIIRKSSAPVMPKEHLSSSSVKLLHEVAASVKNSVNEIQQSQTVALKAYKDVEEAITTVIKSLEKQQSESFAELQESIKTFIKEIEETKQAVSKAIENIQDLKSQQQLSDSPWSEITSEPPSETAGLVNRVQSLERKIVLLAKHLPKLQNPIVESPKPEKEPQNGGLPLNLSEEDNFSDCSASDDDLQFLFSNEKPKTADKQYKLSQ